MDISNINGANAYTTNNPTSKPTEDSPLKNEPLKNEPGQASETDLNQEAARSARQAFEVNITQEARNLLAAEAPAPVKAGPDQSPVATHEARQIVNIIA